MKKNIAKLYKEVKDSYEKIVDVSENSLDTIQSQAEFDLKKKNTNSYLIAISGATLIFILFPFIISKVYSFLEVITLNVFLISKDIETSTLTILNFAFGLGSFAIICYLFLFPSKLFQLGSSSEKFGFVNRRQQNFIWTSIFGTYLAIGLVTMLIFLNFESSREIIASYFIYYLLIPFSILTLFLLVFFIVSILFYPLKKPKNEIFDFSRNTRYEISYKLLDTLNKLSKVENIYTLDSIDFKSIIDELENINSLVEKFPELFYMNTNSLINLEFKKSSYAFQNVICDLMYTKESDLNLVKEKLVSYSNIFLNGDLSTLPKSDLIIEEALVKKAKLIHYILLGIYLTLPITIVIILKSFFKVEIDNYAQSLLKILYIVWAFIGIFSNPFIINNDNKEMIRDIIKTITGK